MRIVNINDFKSLIKRHRLADWITKQDPFICLQEMYLTDKGKSCLRVKHEIKHSKQTGAESKKV